ncbi:hypothetical protein AAFF_G00114600 [Aldrovandia affinis]|uniref:Claudin n=1 Tax=Aldrovandia affinis TaxID=143900 RepID=A0AAD7RSU9_9TELE|nr:hypothetical protein AAFF_G00114600 [Aldrovandia affinis]
MKERSCLLLAIETLADARMIVRVVQIFGFLFTVLGWIFVACTMAMEWWKMTTMGGLGGSNIIKVAWYWSSLWRACFTDSTAVTNCIDFPVLWSVEEYIQGVRGLLMIGLSVGMLGFVLCLMGMECTYIGGKDKHKNRTVLVGGICHIIGALSSFSAYVLYARTVSAEVFFHQVTGQRFDLGTPLFLGWVGSMFEMAGGVFYCVSIRKLLCQKTPDESDAESKASEADSKSKLSAKSQPLSKSKLSVKSVPSSRQETIQQELLRVIRHGHRTGREWDLGRRPVSAEAVWCLRCDRTAAMETMSHSPRFALAVNGVK